MVKRFKEAGGSQEVTAVQEHLWRDGSQVESKPWSERHVWEEHGRVSVLEAHVIKGGKYINEIRLCYGSTWMPWRRSSEFSASWYQPKLEG